MLAVKTPSVPVVRRRSSFSVMMVRGELGEAVPARTRGESKTTSLSEKEGTEIVDCGS